MTTCNCFLWATDYDFHHCLTAQWKVEVVTRSGDPWASNMLRFDTYQQAKEYGQDLFMRWTAVREWRVVEAK